MNKPTKALGVLLASVLLIGCGADSSEIGALETKIEQKEKALARSQEMFWELEEELKRVHRNLPEREATIEEKEADLAKRSKALAKLERAVTQREKAVGVIENDVARNSITDGTWRIGKEVNPGSYRVVARDYCLWYRLNKMSSGTDAGAIIEWGWAEEGTPGLTTIQSGDVAFQSMGCGKWEKVG